MSIVKIYRYIRSADLPSSAREPFEKFAKAARHPAGAVWVWVTGPDATHDFESNFISKEEIAAIDRAVEGAGIKFGECIDIVYSW